MPVPTRIMAERSLKRVPGSGTSRCGPGLVWGRHSGPQLPPSQATCPPSLPLCQFEEGVVDICLQLLDNNPKFLRNQGKDCSRRHSPVYVSRVVSAMVSVGRRGEGWEAAAFQGPGEPLGVPAPPAESSSPREEGARPRGCLPAALQGHVCSQGPSALPREAFGRWRGLRASPPRPLQGCCRQVPSPAQGLCQRPAQPLPPLAPGELQRRPWRPAGALGQPV